MTAPQLEEAATMQCTCEKAMAYQETANRRTVAKQRAEELFGKDAGEYAQPDDTLAYILAGIDQVCDKKSKADHYYYQNEPARKNHADGKG